MTKRVVPLVLSAGALVAVIAGCWITAESEEVLEATPTPVRVDPTSTPSPTPEPSPTPTPMPTPAPDPTPLPTPSPTAVPTTTPEPDPIDITVTETPCCGLFSWLGEDQLLVYDLIPGEPAGSWLFDINSGTRHFVSAGFAVVSVAGVMSFPRDAAGEVATLNTDGTVLGSVDTGGVVAWPSPDGNRLAWLERLPVRTPSSSVNRSVRLMVADIDGSHRREVLELQAAEIHWLPGSRHVMVPARDTGFARAGIWLIDIDTGEVRNLFPELFIQSVRVSPDGRFVAFMRTFNPDPSENGVWVLEIATGGMNRVAEKGSFRWNADGRSLWSLELATTSEETDWLRLVDVDTGADLASIGLGGRVLNDVWEISPTGGLIAYWRESDGQVQVQQLAR